MNLCNIDFSGLDLRFASFTFSNMNGSNFSNCNLKGSFFVNASLRKCNLENTNIDNAEMYNCDLSSAKLKNSSLICSDLRNANLAGANLDNANLSFCKLDNANLSGTSFSGDIISLNNTNILGARIPLYCDFTITKIGDKIDINGIEECVEYWDYWFELSSKETCFLPRKIFHKKLYYIYLAHKLT